VTVDKGEGLINVEALDDQGNYKNFLNLQTIVVSPKGERQTVHLEQTGPGHYEARFPTKDIGLYMLHLLDMQEGQVRGSQSIGASVNYSPEFTAPEPNLNLLRRISETGGGRLLDPLVPSVTAFSHDRKKTFQPRDLWEWLVKFAIVLFTIDVGVRRIQIDRDEWIRAMTLRRWLIFWQPPPRPQEAEESLAALLARREQVRSRQVPLVQPRPELFRPTTPVTELLPGSVASTSRTPGAVAPNEEAAPDGAEPPPATTTSRLLEAKRRAQKRRIDSSEAGGVCVATPTPQGPHA
jgi:hypothetical protein